MHEISVVKLRYIAARQGIPVSASMRAPGACRSTDEMIHRDVLVKMLVAAGLTLTHVVGTAKHLFSLLKMTP